MYEEINIVPSSGIRGISLAVNAIICDDIIQGVYGGGNHLVSKSARLLAPGS